MRVFIVDDSDLLRQRLGAMLSQMQGIEVVGEARDALEATKLILNLKPDVVILDIRMPAGSGIDVLENIKRVRPAPKVIMLTNYPYPQYRKKAEDAGAEFFFDKATEFDKVAEAVEGLRNADCGLRTTD